MLARVAESIYWMARQVERAENLSRFIEVTMNFILDQPENLVDPWEPLIRVTGDHEMFQERYGSYNRGNVITFLAFDGEYGNSMLNSLRCARQNARSVREALSSETFEQINEFYHFVKDAQTRQVEPTAEFFANVRTHALLWNGILDGTMSHDTCWHFANVGRMIERADKTSRILDVKYFNLLPRLDDVGTAIDDLQWSALLLAISGFEAYRREHHLIDIEKVIAFFLFHRNFPRSILHCIAAADWSLSEIEEHSTSPREGVAKSQMTTLRARLNHTTVKDVQAGGMHQFVDALQVELNDIGISLSNDYFHAAIKQ